MSKEALSAWKPKLATGMRQAGAVTREIFDMRLHLTLALITVLALFLTLRGTHRHRFTFANVQEMAKARAAAPFTAPPEVLPPQLKALTPQQEAGIFWKDTYRLWRKKGLPFQVDFYHPLASNPQPHIAPEMNSVDSKGAHRLAYSPTYFNFLNLNFNPPLPANLGYPGFYVRYPLRTADEQKPGALNGFFTAMGATYFRTMAEDQVYGLSARGLSINSVDEKKEEFPSFTNWWLVEPAQGATQLVLYAVLDGPSVAGAYQFTIRPGSVTSVDVDATLYFRQAVDQLGVAPFSSMYEFGENSKNHFGDNVHPEIHDSDGLIFNTSGGDWIWRPLAQSTQRQIYNFIDDGPKGFGLVQRDRDFQHYQDLDLKYNVRPSVFVTPHGDWGKGAVQITQAVTNNTNTDNVVAQWHPDRAFKPGDELEIHYTIDWYMNDANRPPLAYAKATLINDPAPAPPGPPAPPPAAGTSTQPHSPGPVVKPVPSSTPSSPSIVPPPPPVPVPTGTTPVQFLVDFAGDGIENVTPANAPDLELTCSPPETGVRETRVDKNGYGNSWRATFTIVPAKHFVPTELTLKLLPQQPAPPPLPHIAPPQPTPVAPVVAAAGKSTAPLKGKAPAPLDPKAEAARLAALAQVIARAKAGQFKLADWQQFLATISEADVYKDFGPPQVYGTNYWTYAHLLAGEQANTPKQDLEIFFDQGRPVGCVASPSRRALTETWTYTWHQ